MKIGLFGGSFDPIHNSHIKIIEEVLRRELVDEIWIIPCYSHNFGKELTSYEDRAKMIELAFDGFWNVKICDVEKELGGITRTYDTVTELKKRFGYDFYWICGSDCVGEFDRWYRAEDLAKEIKFIVYDRESFELGENSSIQIVTVLDHRPDNISSSEIRVRIKNGTDVSNLVPEKVLNYMGKKRLYKK